MAHAIPAYVSAVEALTVSQTITGDLQVNDDEDWFSVTLPAKASCEAESVYTSSTTSAYCVTVNRLEAAT